MSLQTVETESYRPTPHRMSWYEPFKRLLPFCDLAMDLGTANTLVYLKNHGIVLNEPSVVAVDQEKKKVVAIGKEAKEVFGKTSSNLACVRPVKDGVIADFENTSRMMQHMIARATKAASFLRTRPQIIIGVPSGITQVEKRAVIEAALASGIRKVMLVEEPMAAALGAGLPIDEPISNMIVDIGGGTTEVAVISMNGTVYSHSIRVAGDEMDEAIQRAVFKKHRVQIGIFEAERIKLLLGSAHLPKNKLASQVQKLKPITVFGRDIAEGRPARVEVTEELVRDALSEPVSAIVGSVMTALEQISGEAAQDVWTRGIYLAGGGSLLRGLPEILTAQTGINFYRAHDPLSCVVRGVGKIIDNLRDMKVLCVS